MSTYDDYDEPRRYRTTRLRPRERDEPEFVREETYIERGKGPGPRDLVFRGRDESVEDIPRDFPPPAGRDYPRSRANDEYSHAPSRRARSAAGRRDYDDYDDDRYTDYAAPAAAAGAAGYAAGRRKERDRRHRRDRSYDSEYSDSPPPRRERERRKSGVGEVLEGLGLGGIVGAIAGKSKDKDRSRSRDGSVRSKSTRRGASRSRRYSSSEGSRSRSRGGKDKTERQWAQAAQAALIAGAVEAFRSRKEAGPWTGDKGRRIATAAIGAGGIDRFLDKNPNEKTKRHLAEAVVGGLAANRLANGPLRSKSRGRDMSPDSMISGRTGRSGRSIRSRSRSVIDRLRGRSQSRGRPESPGGGGNGGLKGLVAGGALAAAGKAVYDRTHTGQSQRGTARGVADQRDTNSNNNRDLAGAGAAGAGALALSKGGQGKSEGKSDSISDSSSTTDMENKRKRMRGKELLTAGLATIATIHAAHGVYTSMEAHEKRHRLVAEGEMSPEEARKKQTKAWVQDAAAVGIAALGIKGAFSEWKEMNEQRREIHEIEKRKRERRKRLDQRKRKAEEDRQERMMQMMGQNPQMLAMMGPGGGGGGGFPQMPQMPAYAMPPQADQSGNPYAPRS